MSTIKYKMSPTLQAALAQDGVENYGPAYGGESVGLDLYNAGETLVIQPAYRCGQWELVSKSLDRKWSDISDGPRKHYFKVLIPTGVYVAIPPGFVGLIQERGSVTKSPLKVRAGVIDPGYSGQVFVNAVNLSSVPFELDALAKTPFQLVVVPAAYQYEQVSDEDFEQIHSDSKRYEAMIGSSDQ